MANQSPSQAHPFDYLHLKRLNEERNDPGLNTMVSENHKTSKNQPHRLLFNDPLHLYEYQPLKERSNFAWTSRSMPGSRRNSNEKDNHPEANLPLDSLFSNKLQLGMDQSVSAIPESKRLFANNNQFQPSSTATSSSPKLSMTFDPDQPTPASHPLVTSGPALFQPAYPSTTAFAPPPNSELFGLPKRNNKSLESLRSKSWTQYLDNPVPSGAYLQRAANGTAPMDNAFDDYVIAPTPSAAPAPFYNPSSRRSSYGWNAVDDQYQMGHPTTHPAAPGFAPDLSAGIKSRLTTSQSHNDLRASLHDAQFGFYNGSVDKDVSTICPSVLQYGVCPLPECPFLHPVMPNIDPPVHTAGMATLPSAPHHAHQALPSLYTYPSLFHPPSGSTSPSSSAHTLIASSGIGSTASNPSLHPSSTPMFPVGASSSVYARSGYHPPPNHPATNSSFASHAKHDIPPPSSRRASSDQESVRFANAQLDDFKDHLYELAKDQNGCRFLQRKIEDTSPGNDYVYAIQAVYNEIHSHFVELMTNSFGNYLCQKLLERCNNDQRDTIVSIVAPDIVNISLNMHGTRAVQKLIEFLSTPEQIKMVTAALDPSVVPLIKDLNGNHVIQKCLHRLSDEHRQFIYDAVCQKCIEVATHKHGCCVLQRCIDYASDKQKIQLVQEITRNALTLVQDPYGNYVVQYVLDLGDEDFSDGLIRRFIGHACHLSAQKFSSNVMEKCIRVARPDTRHCLIQEFIDPTAMEKMLRDSFANYVIQTSLDYADLKQRNELVDCIRPLLSTVRSTPYGKRIHGKIFREQTRTQQHTPSFQSQSRRLMNHPDV